MIGRGAGARVDPSTGEIEVLVSSSQWPEFISSARAGRQVALTLCRPQTYECYQVKGVISAAEKASAEGQALATDYVEAMLADLAELGVNAYQLSSTLCCDSMWSVRFWPTTMFLQTPGPGAGSRMAEGAV